MGMTNNEKALELVQKCLDDWPYAATRVFDIMKRLEQVKVLLKEQEPVKPIRLENWWKCPECGQNIVANMKYCPGCGRKVMSDDRMRKVCTGTGASRR